MSATAQARVQSATNQPIPLHARELITKQVYAGLRQTVALQAGEGEENQQAVERLQQMIQQATSDRKLPLLHILFSCFSRHFVSFVVTF